MVAWKMRIKQKFSVIGMLASANKPFSFTTTNFIMNGSGTYTGTGLCNLEIDTSGTIIITGSITLSRRFIITNVGTITMTAGGILSVGGAITIGTASGTWTPGTGTLIFTATNTLPATIFTSFNNLTISAGTTSFGTVARIIDGTLDIKTSAIVNLGTLTTHTAKGLFFNGVQQVAGQWGYSGASNNNTTFFANNAGRVTVSGRYYSNGNNAPNLTASWWDNRDGTGSSPANFTTAGQEYYVQSGHTMTTGATWSVSGTGSKVQIESGGILQSDHTTTMATTVPAAVMAAVAAAIPAAAAKGKTAASVDP